MRRQIEVALVAVVAAMVGAVAYHAVDTWPSAAETPQPPTISIAPTTFRINGDTIRIYGEPIRINDDPLPLTFEVTGTGQVDVTYSPDASGTTTHTRVTAPWKTTVQAPPHIGANAVTLTARTTSTQAGATVTCRIVITEFTGIPFAEDTDSGPHAEANC
ncbi:hypothetical protein ACFY36_43600 [Actinoplanes sp. NPDC000266]